MTIGEVIPMYPIQGPKMDDLLSTMKHTLSNKSSVYGQVLGMLYRYVWEVILILGVAFVVYRGMYLCFYHPLSKFPGPFLAKFSNAYAGYRSMRGDMHLDICKQHERYGKFVRYGPNRVSVKSVTALHDVYGFRNSLQKADSYNTMNPWPGVSTSATTINKAQHKPLRRTVARGLSTANLVGFEGALNNVIDHFCTILLKGPRDDQGWAEPRNMANYNEWLGYDTMSDYGFGKRIGMMDNPSLRFIAEVLKMHTKKMAFYETWPQLTGVGIGSIVAKLLPMFSNTVQRFNEWHMGFAQGIIELNSSEPRGVYGSIVQNSREVNAKGTHGPMQSKLEGSFILNTSADNHASVLCTIQFYLAHHPEVYKRLKKEIYSTFQSVEEIKSGSGLSSCAYLRAVIDETMRITSPASGMFWRQSVNGGAVVDGEYLPEGCETAVNFFAVQRDEENFRDAHRFWPERWLPGVLSEEERAAAQHAYKPFELGPRSCTGREAALHALNLQLARLLYQVDFKLADGPLGRVGEGNPDGPWGRRQRNEFQIETHFVNMYEGPYLCFKEASARPQG